MNRIYLLEAGLFWLGALLTYFAYKYCFRASLHDQFCDAARPLRRRLKELDAQYKLSNRSAIFDHTVSVVETFTHFSESITLWELSRTQKASKHMKGMRFEPSSTDLVDSLPPEVRAEVLKIRLELAHEVYKFIMPFGFGIFSLWLIKKYSSKYNARVTDSVLYRAEIVSQAEACRRVHAAA